MLGNSSGVDSKGLYLSQEKENRFLAFTSSTRSETRKRRSRTTTAKKCTKKRRARAGLWFCQSKPIAFLAFSLPSSSSLLKDPNIAHSHKESVPYHLAVPSFLAVLVPQTLPKQRKYT